MQNHLPGEMHPAWQIATKAKSKNLQCLDRVAKQHPFEEVTFENKPERSEKASH